MKTRLLVWAIVTSAYLFCISERLIILSLASMLLIAIAIRKNPYIFRNVYFWLTLSVIVYGISPILVFREENVRSVMMNIVFTIENCIAILMFFFKDPIFPKSNFNNMVGDAFSYPGSILFFWYLLAIGGPINFLSQNYLARLSLSGVNAYSRLWLVFISYSLLYQLSRNSRNSRKYDGLAILVMFMLIALYNVRSYLILTGLFLLAVKSKKKTNLGLALVVISIGYIILIVINTFRGNWSNFSLSHLSYANFAFTSFGEFINPGAVIQEYLSDSKFKYRFGGTYINLILSIVSGRKEGFLTPAYQRLQDYYPGYLEAGKGLGYFTFAEGYLNAGYLGVVIHFFLLWAILIWIATTLSKIEGKMIYVAIPFSILFVRMDLSIVIDVLRFMVIPSYIFKFISPNILILFPKKENAHHRTRD